MPQNCCSSHLKLLRKMRKRTTTWVASWRTKVSELEAIDELKRAVELQRDFADGYRALGLASQRTGDANGAIAAFRRVVELQPDNPDARNNLGLALVQSGDAANAVVEFQTALRLQPETVVTAEIWAWLTCSEQISTQRLRNSALQ
jgi:tetratricopeptide (TPR) repeat protein